MGLTTIKASPVVEDLVQSLGFPIAPTGSKFLDALLPVFCRQGILPAVLENAG